MDALSGPVVVIVAVAWTGGFGLASARMAKVLDRLQPVWFVFGAILGPVALLLLNAAPPSRCRTCGTPTRGWGHICWWCHEDVRRTNASVVAMAARMSSRFADTVLPNIARRPRRPDLNRPLAVQSNRIYPPRPTSEQPEPRSAPTPTTETWTARFDPPVPSTRREPNGSRPTDEHPQSRADRAPERTADDTPQVIATAVFVVGSARLEPGRRYSLALRSTRLLVLGPTDVDPSAIVLDRPVAEVEVRAVEGRLVISEPRSGSGLVLAFMSVAGATTADIAALITDATQASRLA